MPVDTLGIASGILRTVEEASLRTIDTTRSEPRRPAKAVGDLSVPGRETEAVAVDSLGPMEAVDFPATGLRAWDHRVTIEPNAPVTTSRAETGLAEDLPWQVGLAPFNRAPVVGYDSGVMCVVLATFLLFASNCRYYSTFLKNFWQNLFKPRRDSIFDDHTVSETRIQLSLVILLCVCEGSIAFSALKYLGTMPEGVFLPLLGCIATAGLYYLWQLGVYNLVGYVFTDKPGRVQWIKGFNASQILLGVALIVPMVCVLFYPVWGRWIVWVSLILYLLARCIFLIRGFRVFYENFGSLCYFILYLCALEIAPLIILLKLRFFLE